MRSGAKPSPAISRSTSAATAWAWARSLAHRQNATSPLPTEAGSTARGSLVHRPPRPRQDPRRGSEVSPSSTTRASAAGEPVAAGDSAPRSDAGRVVAATVRFVPGDRSRERRRRPGRVLRVVDQHVLERRPAMAGRSRTSEAHRGQVAGVAARRPRPAAARGPDTPRRTRARVGARSASSVASASRAAHARTPRPRPVRPSSRSIRRMKPARSAPALPPKSWRSSGSSSIRSSSMASRSAGPSTGSSGSRPGPESRVEQQPCASSTGVIANSSLVTAARALLDRARAASARGVRAGPATASAPGVTPCSTSHAKRALERPGLAGAGGRRGSAVAAGVSDSPLESGSRCRRGHHV